MASQIKTKERVQIIGTDDRSHNVSLILRSLNEPGHIGEIYDADPTKLVFRPDDFLIQRNDSGKPWSTQAISYEEDIHARTSYAYWMSLVRATKRELRDLRASVSRAFFQRLVHRFTRNYYVKKWTGETRMDRTYREVVAVGDALWAISPVDYYKTLLRDRNNDAKAKAWLRAKIAELESQPKGSDPVMWYWLQRPNERPPQGGHLVQAAAIGRQIVELPITRFKTVRELRHGVDWTKVYQRWHGVLGSRDRKISKVAKRLAFYYKKARECAFSSTTYRNRVCSQQDSVATLHVPPIPVYKGVINALALGLRRGEVINNRLFPSFGHISADVGIAYIEGFDGAAFTDWISHHDHLTMMEFIQYTSSAEHGECLCSATWSNVDTFLASELCPCFHKDISPATPNSPDWTWLMHGECVPLKSFVAHGHTSSEFTNDPDELSWDLIDVPEDWSVPSTFSTDYALNGQSHRTDDDAGNLGSISIRSLDGPEFVTDVRNAQLLNRAKLLALDIPERRKTLPFNMTRSLGELKDSPETLRGGKEFINFVLSHRKDKYVEFSFGAQKSRLGLSSTPDSLVARFGAVGGFSDNAVIRNNAIKRFRRVYRISQIRVSPVSTATVPTLASLYLCWKFGVAQTLSDINAVCRYGYKWAWDARRGLNQLLEHLSDSQPFHVIGRSYCVTNHTTRERRAPRSANGLRPFLEQSVDAPDILLPESETVDFHFSLLREYFERGGAWYSVSWPYLFEGTLPYIPSDEDPNVRLLCPDIAYQVEISTPEVLEMKIRFCEANNAAINRHIARLAKTEIVMAQSVAGRHWAVWSLAGLYKAVKMDKLLKVIADTDPLMVAWELAPCSFIVEWFTNLRELVDHASTNLKRVLGKIASPMQGVWECIRVRLWAGCPERTRSFTMELIWSRPIWSCFYWRSRGVESSSDPRWLYHACAEDEVRLSRLYSDATLRIHYTRGGSLTTVLHKTRIRRFTRVASKNDGFEAPSFRARVQLTVGKLFSLAAMVVARRSK